MFIFLLDTFVKVTSPLIIFRYITKAALIGMLLFHFLIKNNNINKKDILVTIYAICSFIIGDAFIIAGNTSRSFLIIGVVFFAIGKILYSIRFSNKKDFNILKLIPFLLFCFSYMSVVMIIVYNSLGSYFIPVLFYLFIVMLTAQFAYLRKYEVNKISYFLVLTGIVFSMFSDSITLLKIFYDEAIAYNEYTIMLFYSLSQYFIVIGLIKENSSSNNLSEVS